MAKTKYNEKTFPRLAKGYAMRGLTDEQIAGKLKISPATLYNYIKKYPEFAEALEEGKAPFDMEVEQALLSRALGYDFTETKHVYEGEHLVRSEKTTKHQAANPDSIKFWLTNRRPQDWTLKQDVNLRYEKLSEDDLDKLVQEVFKGDKP